MHDHLASLMALCGSASGPATLLAALLLAGLVGSMVHCVPMCGPFVLAQVSSRLSTIGAARLCERHRVTNGLLLPYHLGRLTTYALLGVLAASAGATLGAVPALRWVPPILLLLGAAMFAVQAARRLWPKLRPHLRAPHLKPPNFMTAGPASIARIAGRIDRARPGGAFLLGVVLGFLPCGLLYSALAVAGSIGSPALGGLAMLTFGLGTVPALAILGIAGQLGSRAWGGFTGQISPALLLASAALMLTMAWSQLALIV